MNVGKVIQLSLDFDCCFVFVDVHPQTCYIKWQKMTMNLHSNHHHHHLLPCHPFLFLIPSITITYLLLFIFILILIHWFTFLMFPIPLLFSLLSSTFYFLIFLSSSSYNQLVNLITLLTIIIFTSLFTDDYNLLLSTGIIIQIAYIIAHQFNGPKLPN